MEKKATQRLEAEGTKRKATRYNPSSVSILQAPSDPLISIEGTLQGALVVIVAFHVLAVA